jgi:NAD(P)-dependent dehydrogenase (short-subunit alcohol dehydrogenase family)
VNALVTGATRGIGRAIAAQLAAAGLRVLCHASTAEDAQTVADEVEGRAVWGDLATPSGIARVAAQAIEAAPALQLLVHNAGVNLRPDETVDEVELATFRAVFAVNVEAPILLTQALLGALRAGAPAHVLVVSSEAGRFSTGLGEDGLTYRMSKAAVNAFALIAAQALRPDGIRVNAVHPGWARTDMGGARAPLSPEEAAGVVVGVALRDDDPTGLMFDSTGAVAW